MNWILLVLIIGGDVNSVTTIDFGTKESCELARDFLLKADIRHNIIGQPKAQCFQRR